MGMWLKQFDMKYKIIGYTKVFVPSENHEEVPYFQYLLESEEGNGY